MVMSDGKRHPPASDCAHELLGHFAAGGTGLLREELSWERTSIRPVVVSLALACAVIISLGVSYMRSTLQVRDDQLNLTAPVAHQPVAAEPSDVVNRATWMMRRQTLVTVYVVGSDNDAEQLRASLAEFSGAGADTSVLGLLVLIVPEGIDVPAVVLDDSRNSALMSVVFDLRREH